MVKGKNVWFTSDWHIGDHRLDILRRPFENHDSMFAKIKENFNKLVSNSDDVYILGDVCYKHSESYLPLVRTLNGKKHLIKGNHDREIENKKFLNYFDTVVEDGEGLEITIKGIDFYLTHYPTTARIDKFNLVGHVHDAWKFLPNMINVGVDVNHYCPVNIDQILFYYNSVLSHFDKDIWAAYLRQNMAHINSRANLTSYSSEVKAF